MTVERSTVYRGHEVNCAQKRGALEVNCVKKTGASRLEEGILYLLLMSTNCEALATPLNTLLMIYQLQI